MLRKLYLVPQGLYEGLLANETTLDNYPQQLIDKTIANKDLDVSSKNALLNQRTHGYLKHKRAIDNKPIKVALIRKIWLLQKKKLKILSQWNNQKI